MALGEGCFCTNDFPRKDTTIAKFSMALAELVEKGAEDDVVRELPTHVAQRLMDFEIEQRTGAEYGEWTGDRSNSRNGYRDRLWETRAGSIDLRIVVEATYPGFSSRDARRRRRSSPSFKKPTSRASRRDRSTSWFVRWG